MANAYLSLGTNLGDKQNNLMRAIALLSERAGSIVALSGLYDTEPWGFHSENRFLQILRELNSLDRQCPHPPGNHPES